MDHFDTSYDLGQGGIPIKTGKADHCCLSSMPGLCIRYSGTCVAAMHFPDSPRFGESPLGVTMATTGIIKLDWLAETCLGAEIASFSPVERGDGEAPVSG